MQTLNGIDSKFRLAILVARRAKQLLNGAHRKVEIKSDNSLTVAMEEFRQGKIDFDVLNEEDSIFGQPVAEEGATTEAAAESGEAEEENEPDAGEGDEPEKGEEPAGES
ncbi:MAG TPA: DNA-directed RNA polymerase subunit omega [Candidatus Aminicenantes bacterium]|nr:DNA-directed RNA polymerase subunit omega [Candidatus Aminicenantes bacterium]